MSRIGAPGFATMFLMAFGVGSPQPLLQCSVCRTAVDYAVDGTIVYPRDMDAGKIRRVLLAHTKLCLEAAEAQFQDDGGGPCLMPLEEYLAHFSAPARVRPMKPLVAVF